MRLLVQMMNQISSVYQIISGLLLFAATAGGFYLSTKKRLDKIETEIDLYRKFQSEIIDKLARIETKIDIKLK